MSEQKLKVFEDLSVSTNTFIVTTNLLIDIAKMAQELPVTLYTLVPKRRGRKKKNASTDINKNIPSGSIITVEHGDIIRGVDLKNKKKKNIKKQGYITYFRNSVTVVIIIEEKKFNIKISKSKFQITGCKTEEQAENCVFYVWKYIKDIKDIYTFTDGNNYLVTMFIPAMRNIDFDLGYQIDREKLDEYFNTYTDYFSLLETSIGYTGVNIKKPVNKTISNLMIRQRDIIDDKWQPVKMVPYSDYLNILNQKEQDKKINKKRYNTFLVFHSGKIIMSSLCAEYAKDAYYKFMDIVIKNRPFFEEKIKS